MSVPVAYTTILLIWSTTPLGIAFSNQTISPMAAVGMRMFIAAILGYAILRLFGIHISWGRKARRTYGFSLLGVFGAMTFTYLGAQYIPSGLISVIFALSPVLSNLLAMKLLGEGDFSPVRWIAFLVSFLGLAIICMEDWVVRGDGWIGVCSLLLAVFFYALSGVLVQKERYQAHPLSITVGTLLCSLPLFALSWYLFDREIPALDFSSVSPWAVLYLAVFGSLLGFAAYFHIIRNLGATAVAMVTLVTPVMALILGSLLNNEPITMQMVIGTIGVLSGLVLYYSAGTIRRARRAIRFTQK